MEKSDIDYEIHCAHLKKLISGTPECINYSAFKCETKLVNYGLTLTCIYLTVFPKISCGAGETPQTLHTGNVISIATDAHARSDVESMRTFDIATEF